MEMLKLNFMKSLIVLLHEHSKHVEFTKIFSGELGSVLNKCESYYREDLESKLSIDIKRGAIQSS